MSSPPLFSHPLARTLACLLGALLAAVMVCSGATLYLPLNEIDRVGLPAVLFPVVWAGLLIFATVTRSIGWVWGVLLGLCLVHGVLIYGHLLGG